MAANSRNLLRTSLWVKSFSLCARAAARQAYTNMQKMTSVQARHQLCIIEHGKVKFTDIRVNPIIVRDFASS